MDKHTFKVGDRVIFTDPSLKLYDGSKGQYWEGVHCGGTLKLFGVKFDNDYLNRSVCNREFFSVWSHSSLKHDTDFQVGDWVRYEGVNHLKVPSKEGQVGVITSINNRGYVRARGICADLYLDSQPTSDKSNLVKIQPPQKDSDDTIIHVFTSYTNKEEKKNMYNVFSITHEKYGVVQGVHQVAPGCYCKNGAHYYHGEGWREVEEWVKIEVRKAQWETIKTQVGTLKFEAWGLDDNCHTVSWRPAK